eukprot:2776085-Lingulodinium_polyedra.AAC.1
MMYGSLARCMRARAAPCRTCAPAPRGPLAPAHCAEFHMHAHVSAARRTDARRSVFEVKSFVSGT